METQTEAPKKDERDIVARLRDTPNWLREPWSVSWKDLTHKYDRAPFEAAEEIERLRYALQTMLGDTDESDYMTAAEKRAMAYAELTPNAEITGG